ncbi:response regulator [Confluentibacter sediminis]|uniref:response regulator n=1 Tax=Confluentibacter sediminis TaxID=2219045 RepID=UPI000DAC4A09|nr:response regulator [Confluentibacter sediminis]
MKKINSVYVIDDDEIYQFTIKKILKSFDLPFEIKSFPDGEEAINFIDDHKNNEAELPDIVFLDINMPIMDGFEFLEEFEKIKSDLCKNTIVHMVSSSVDEVDIERAKKNKNISSYITKPVNPKEIERIIKSF